MKMLSFTENGRRVNINPAMIVSMHVTNATMINITTVQGKYTYHILENVSEEEFLACKNANNYDRINEICDGLMSYL